jgi:hypothetical protein
MNNESRLSGCCAEKVLGQYRWEFLDGLPSGICSGCGRKSKFYTEKEFEILDFELTGRNYGEKLDEK